MKLKLILAGLAFALILASAGYVKSLIAENAEQKVALDNMAKTLLIQDKERKKAMRLSIERQDAVQRLSRALEDTKNELAALPSSEQYKACRQADLPADYNEHIQRVHDAARRRERGP